MHQNGSEGNKKKYYRLFHKAVKSGQSLGNIKCNCRGSYQQDAIILSIF